MKVLSVFLLVLMSLVGCSTQPQSSSELDGWCWLGGYPQGLGRCTCEVDPNLEFKHLEVGPMLTNGYNAFGQGSGYLALRIKNSGFSADPSPFAVKDASCVVGNDEGEEETFALDTKGKQTNLEKLEGCSFTTRWQTPMTEKACSCSIKDGNFSCAPQ